MQQEKLEKKPKPVTVRIEDFKENLSRVVAEAELPPFLLEMLLGEYLAGVSQVAKLEYAQDRAEYEKEEQSDGRHNE